MRSAADRRLYLLVAASVIVLDVVTKVVAEQALRPIQGVPVLGEFVQLRLVYNPGAAFGLHLGPWSRWIFLAFAVGASYLMNRWSAEAAPGQRFYQLALSLVTGGAIGNALDRIRGAQGVVDFIDIGVGTLRWPTFNVADIAVTCGAIALALAFMRQDAAARDSAARDAAAREPAAPAP